jgi:hypothetical protein
MANREGGGEEREEDGDEGAAGFMGVRIIGMADGEDGHKEREVDYDEGTGGFMRTQEIEMRDQDDRPSTDDEEWFSVCTHIST